MADVNAKAKGLPASPGFKGAVKDAFEAIAKATAPRSVVQRRAKIESEVDSDRYRRNQTTDSNN